MIKNKKILSVITARKGSKGILNKNIRELMGKPLFEWSVLSSLNSEYVDKTVISSDSEKIEDIYIENIKKDKKWKEVSFIKRPKSISGDLSKNEEALIHAYNWMKEIYKKEFEIIINLQPTSPCRTEELLDKCIFEYSEGGHNSLLTASVHTPFFWQKINNNWEYIDRFFYIDNIKKPYQESAQWQLIKAFDNCCNRKMRQEFRDLDKNNSDFLLHDCGNIYITDTKVLLSTNCRIGNKPCIYPVEKLNSLQIDTEYDFKLIEKMVEAYNLKSLI